MATITAINRPKGQTRGGMHSVIKYVMQDKKTIWDDEKLVSGQACIPQFAYSEMMATKEIWNKQGDKMYFHFVQSFSDRECITPKQAHEIAVEFAKHWKGFEVVIATHSDTDNVHTHFVINSVNHESGKKYHCDKDEIVKLHNLNDELCKKYGFTVSMQKREPGTMPYTQAEYRSADRGESWKLKLQLAIDNAMKYAVNRHSFFELMESEGYSVKWTNERKNITFTCPNGMKCRDNKLHEKKYLKEMMEYELLARRKYVEGTEGTSHESYGAGNGYGEGNDGDREKLVGTLETDGRRIVGPEENRGEGFLSCNIGGDGNAALRAGSNSFGDTRNGNSGTAVDAKLMQQNVDDTIERILGGDIFTGWEEERRTLFSLLGAERKDRKMGEKTRMDRSHTVGGGNGIINGAVSLADGMSGIIKSDFSDDPSDDDDIDKKLREEIRRVKMGENFNY